MGKKRDTEIEIMSVLGSHSLTCILLDVLGRVSKGISIGTIKPEKEGDIEIINALMESCVAHLKVTEEHIKILLDRL